MSLREPAKRRKLKNREKRKENKKNRENLTSFLMHSSETISSKLKSSENMSLKSGFSGQT